MAPDAERMPAVFFGHGNPMNALEPKPYGEAWRRVGASLPRPKAILSISAHWYTRGTAVTAEAMPRTIHDFVGFPPALFEVRYPAPGDPTLASRVRDLLAPFDVRLDPGWGLDHGTWSVLVHAFPKADVPVVQLSLDATKPARFHYDLGARLASLRDEGVLVIGSGNLVHNLGRMEWSEGAAPFDWAVRFDAKVRECLERRDHAPLLDLAELGDDARLSVPTPDHYLPLLYVAALQRADDVVSFPVEGIEHGSIGMRAVAVGLRTT